MLVALKPALCAELTAAVRDGHLSRAGGGPACTCMHWHRYDLGRPCLLVALPRQCLHQCLQGHRRANMHTYEPSRAHTLGLQCPGARLSSGSIVSACAAARTSTLRSAACCGLRAASCRTRSGAPRPALVAPTCTARICSLSGRPIRLPPVYEAAATRQQRPEQGLEREAPAEPRIGVRWSRSAVAGGPHRACWPPRRHKAQLSSQQAELGLLMLPLQLMSNRLQKTLLGPI